MRGKRSSIRRKFALLILFFFPLPGSKVKSADGVREINIPRHISDQWQIFQNKLHRRKKREVWRSGNGNGDFQGSHSRRRRSGTNARVGILRHEDAFRIFNSMSSNGCRDSMRVKSEMISRLEESQTRVATGGSLWPPHASTHLLKHFAWSKVSRFVETIDAYTHRRGDSDVKQINWRR